jgi:Protein of unknown function (DUF1759)
MFTAIVNSDPSMAPIVKFQYLKNSLELEAEEKVKEVLFTNDKYGIASKILLDKYNPPKIIVLNTIQTFLKLTTQYFTLVKKLEQRETCYKILYGPSRSRAII